MLSTSIASARRLAVLLILPMLCGVLACAQTAPARNAPGAATQSRPAAPTVSVPQAPAKVLYERKVVAQGLWNPRGMQRFPDGSLLVAEAGTGDPEGPLTGRLVRLIDRNADGDFLDDEDERVALLERQPSKNILDIVRRDEVFGLAGMALGQDQGQEAVLVALAFFGGPSTLLSVHGNAVREWGSTHLNINDVTYDAARQRWYGVASTTDEVVHLLPGRGVERLVALPRLRNGQDAVPGYLRADPLSGRLLVSLFTGSPEGEEGGLGVELVPRAGGIISVDPDSGRWEWLVSGLTVPTDLEVAPDGTIYVLEFCDAFLDPVPTRQAMLSRPMHGGFRRFSGRLLRVGRADGRVSVIAEGLDAPSNLALWDDALYVAEGMGTPGRQIPGPKGVVSLQGFIERIALR